MAYPAAMRWEPPADAMEPFALSQSWPVREQSRRFELGQVLNAAAIDLVEPSAVGALAPSHSGCWECNLADNSLIWSGGVYDIFGWPRGREVTRDETVALYCEDSRAKMERLRAYAIKHRRGFTIDVQIRAAVGELRWMRIIAAPVCGASGTLRLHGLKLIV